jgi:hypothetical protein
LGALQHVSQKARRSAGRVQACNCITDGGAIQTYCGALLLLLLLLLLQDIHQNHHARILSYATN